VAPRDDATEYDEIRSMIYRQKAIEGISTRIANEDHETNMPTCMWA
jgi:hypothetical protein